jgi:hypothetical protein
MSKNTSELVYDKEYHIWRDEEYLGKAMWTNDENIGDAFIRVCIDEFGKLFNQVFIATRWACSHTITKQRRNKMSDLKTRLETEKTELEEKLDKLDAFLLSEKVKDVDDAQKALLQVQATAMNTYLQCLKERIERL